MLISASYFESALSHLRGWRGRRLGFDTETTGLCWSVQDQMIGVSVWCPEFGFYFPFRHPTGNLSDRHLSALIEELEQHHLVAFNAKFDLHHMRRDGMRWPRAVENAHLLAHLANENEPAFDLKTLSAKYLGPESVEESKQLDALLSERGLKKGQLSLLQPFEVAPYAVADARLALQLADNRMQIVTAWRLSGIAAELSEYERITYDMEEHGLLLDLNVVQELEDRANPALLEDKKILSSFFGVDVNPRSSKQVPKLLGTRDSKDETLELCKHPMAAVVRRARKWATMKSNYCAPYRRFLGADGAIHPSYNLGGTVAGRPSCSDPNMQGVAKSDEVYRVKDCFKARPGTTLISADYSQAELRLGAHYTDDPALIAILRAGGDVHGATAQKLKIDRDSAKRINFGIVYGLGAPGLSKQLHITESEARSLLNTWNRGFPMFKKTRVRVVQKAKECGYIRMWTGRVRRFVEPVSPPHKAFSSLVQGGVAEILRHSLMRLDKIGQGVRPILQVYDQVLFEVPTPIVRPAVSEIRRCMEDFKFKVGLKVDISIGQTWGSLVKEEKWQE